MMLIHPVEVRFGNRTGFRNTRKKKQRFSSRVHPRWLSSALFPRIGGKAHFEFHSQVVALALQTSLPNIGKQGLVAKKGLPAKFQADTC
jgi:hypothetical protein